PWHYAGLPGQSKRLLSHPRVHEQYRDTVLVVDPKKKQKVVWWSETEFSDITIAPSKHLSPLFPKARLGGPKNPFKKELVVVPPAKPNGKGLWVVRSTVPRKTANHHMYKIEFTMKGKKIDPDMYCGAP